MANLRTHDECLLLEIETDLDKNKEKLAAAGITIKSLPIRIHHDCYTLDYTGESAIGFLFRPSLIVAYFRNRTIKIRLDGLRSHEGHMIFTTLNPYPGDPGHYMAIGVLVRGMHHHASIGCLDGRIENAVRALALSGNFADALILALNGYCHYQFTYEQRGEDIARLIECALLNNGISVKDPNPNTPRLAMAGLRFRDKSLRRVENLVIDVVPKEQEGEDSGR